MTLDDNLSSYKPWVRNLIADWERLQHGSNKQIAYELLPNVYASDPTRATENVRKKIGKLIAKGILAFDQDKIDPGDLEELRVSLGHKWANQRAKQASTGAYLAKVIRETVAGLPQTLLSENKWIIDPKGATLVAVVTDVQWGRKTPDYNEAVAIERLNRFHDEIERASIDSGAENLVMVYAGDIVDGDQIFPSQPFQVTMPAVKQYLSVSNYLAQKLVSLAHLFSSIDAVGVCGNHGRMQEKGEGYFLNNWDYLVYHHIAQMCSNQPNIKWKIPEDWYIIHPVRHINLLITHGDACSGGDGISSLRKAALKWSAAMSHSWEVLICGHFHSPAWIAQNDKWISICGTVCSGDDFSLRVVKERTPPSQRILLIREGNLSIQVTDVRL